ncbi:uncharacterized protein EI97DRAFT_185087 [Westerdykella ornata]|uniref:Transmembrane protein n=1 Tax=Westerdykella ornata TaxID=318751 RepID=A0A6A6JV78_WESOR|nr:uncharacterized protein EI97DRAFT_185087 [Westerdykella ornata]KAF2279728.1 hypothetical protein EI97DRAFT_185087 [Westerdykella ornata]
MTGHFDAGRPIGHTQQFQSSRKGTVCSSRDPILYYGKQGFPLLCNPVPEMRSQRLRSPSCVIHVIPGFSCLSVFRNRSTTCLRLLSRMQSFRTSFFQCLFHFVSLVSYFLPLAVTTAAYRIDSYCSTSPSLAWHHGSVRVLIGLSKASSRWLVKGPPDPGGTGPPIDISPRHCNASFSACHFKFPSAQSHIVGPPIVTLVPSSEGTNAATLGTMTESSIYLDDVAAEHAHWSPWWIWLLLALWIFGTLSFVHRSLQPRYHWSVVVGRWVWKVGDFFLHNAIVAASTEEGQVGEGEGVGLKREIRTFQQCDVASSVTRGESPARKHHRRRSTKEGGKMGTSVTELEIELEDIEVPGMGSLDWNYRGKPRRVLETGWRRLG